MLLTFTFLKHSMLNQYCEMLTLLAKASVVSFRLTVVNLGIGHHHALFVFTVLKNCYGRILFKCMKVAWPHL